MAIQSDIRAWAAQQAALLRRLAAGEDVRDRVDWPKIIAEIEKIGGSDSPLSAEEEAEIRRDTRRWAARARISNEEWARAEGFPFWPRWVIPAVIAAAGVSAFVGGMALTYFLR